MTMLAPPPAPDTVEVRAALARVVGSAELRGSPQLVTFLRFIVETTLGGGADRLKAYTIGTEALGRDSSFDPQGDPIVRVEAQRLRRALSAYYATTGADDAVIIDVPRGGYVPVFHHRGADREAQAAPPKQAPEGRRRIPRLFVAAAATLVLIAAVVAAAIVWRIPTTGDAAPPPETGSVSLVGAPVIVIEPIQAMPASASSLAADLSRELADALAHVQAITVMFAPATNANDAGSARSTPTGAYRLTGIVASPADEVANVTLRLVADGTIAWTRDWRIANGKPGVETISREAAIDVAALSGIMMARLRAQSNQLSPGYRCVLAAADSLRKFDLTQHDRVRDCLERTTEQDPKFAIAFGMLAFVYEREYLHDLSRRVGEAPPLELSLRAAQRAVALNPNGAAGHLALMENMYLRGGLTGAFAAGEKAVSLNPLDGTISGLVGLRMLLGGETERGTELLKNATSRFGTNPSYVEFGLFCIAYLKGDKTAAAQHADPDANSIYPYGLVARALVAAAAGDRDRARQAIRRLTTLYPGWSDPKAMLGRFIRKPEIVDRLARDLAAITQP